MSIVNISVEDNALNRINKLLSDIPGGVYKATYAALKRAGATAKTKAGQYAAEEYTISKGDFMSNVKCKIDINGSEGSVTSLNIRYAGTVLPLLTFNTKFSKNGFVQTQVKRNNGATTLERAFVADIFGKTGVFERIGVPRFPVEQKYGPSTGHMMQNEQVVDKMEKTLKEAFENRVEHEISRVLNGWG